MNIDDGQVAAFSGEMLAEGTFTFRGKGSEGLQTAASGKVGVRPGRGGRGTAFTLYANPVRDSDGLWSAGRALHTVTFERTIALLEGLLDYPSFVGQDPPAPPDRISLDLRAENSAFAWVVVDAADGSIPIRAALLGRADAVRIDAHRDAHAIAITIALEVPAPRRGETVAPPLLLEVTARLSFATLALAGSPLWWQGGVERWSVPSGDQSGPLARRLTLDRAGGAPFFRGHLDFGGGRKMRAEPAWVRATIAEDRLQLTAPDQVESAVGFTEGSRTGPMLEFYNLGPAMWKRMLGDRDEAGFEQTGAGIGHVEGVTGREAGEIGPHQQAITSLQVQLFRSEEGLRIAFRGMFGPLTQKPTMPPLGPEFHGEFLIPAVFLFARGMASIKQWQERQRQLGKS